MIIVHTIIAGDAAEEDLLHQVYVGRPNMETKYEIAIET